MKKIHNAEFGFAMFLAIDFAVAIQTQQDKSNLDWAKDDDLSIAQQFCPFLDFEKGNKQVAKLIEFIHENDGQTSLFDPKSFMNHIKVLFDMVRKGELKPILALQESLWRPYDDNNSELGAMIELDLLLNFHKKMAQAKHLVVWRYGSFLAVADISEEAL